MKIIFHIVFAFLMSLAQAGPIIIGNAAGESEFNILLAQRGLSNLFNQCLALASCRGTMHLQSEIDQLGDALAQLVQTPIEFVANSEISGRIYHFDSSTKVLRLNRDRLYTVEQNKILSFDEGDSTALLVRIATQEFAHQELKEDLLMALKDLAQRILKEKYFNVDVHLTVRSFYFNEGLFSFALLHDGNQISQTIFDIKGKLHCKDINGLDTDPSLISVSDLGLGFRYDKPEFSTLALSIELRLSCALSEVAKKVLTHRLLLNLDLKILRGDHPVFATPTSGFTINSIEEWTPQ